MADVNLPSIFGDHMVLQQEIKIPVWGMADPEEEITVTVADHTGKTTAGPDGKWRVDLAPFPNGTPATTMTVTGKNTLTFQDVLVGDVWLASGQSNMWYSLAMANTAQDIPGQAGVVYQAHDPEIRLFLVSQKTSLQPLTDVFAPYFWRDWDGINHQDYEGDHRGQWVVCAEHPAGNFSAIAYYFAAELHADIKRPIGLIGSYWPGSPAESWVSISGLQQSPPFQNYFDLHQQILAAFPTLDPDYEKAHAKYMANLKDYDLASTKNLNDFSAATTAWQAASKQAQAAGQAAPPQPTPTPNPPAPVAPTSPDGGMDKPGNLFNAMIAPLIPYAIKGVIWYQGESNASKKAPEYRLLFPRLITDWREKWGEGNFPFL